MNKGILFILLFSCLTFLSYAEKDQPTSPTTSVSSLTMGGEQRVWAELGKVFGSNFSLATDPETGVISYEMGDKEGLKFFMAKSGVHIISEALELKCDTFEYNGTQKVVVATGNPLFMRQGDISANCGKFVFYPEKKRSELSEKPVIFSKDKTGKTVETTGKKIFIEQDAQGNTSVMIEGNAQLNVQAKEETKKSPEQKEAEKPTKIDETTIKKIKEVEMAE